METQQYTTRYFNALSVTPSGICVIRDYIPSNRIRLRDESDFQQQNQPVAHDRFRHNGTLSPYSARKMRRAIEWLLVIARRRKQWCRSAKTWVNFRICFVTLTLPAPQRHTDQVIKSRCLNPLLIELRKHHGMRNYVWRAEKQANGNIHFHLLTDTFIEADILRRRWNRIVNTLGYVDDYTHAMQSRVHNFSDYYNLYIAQGSYAQLMRRYNRGTATAWSDPNTTDIHSVRKIKNLIAYLLKYMSKNIENPDALTPEQRARLLVSGQLWNLSETLSRMRSVIIPIGSPEHDEITRLWAIPSYEKHDNFYHYKSLPIREIIRHGCTLLWEYITARIRQNFDTAPQLF